MEMLLFDLLRVGFVGCTCRVMDFDSVSKTLELTAR